MSNASDFTFNHPQSTRWGGGRPSDASDGRRDSRLGQRRPRLPLFPSFSEFDDDDGAKRNDEASDDGDGDESSEAKASPRPAPLAASSKTPTPRPPHRASDASRRAGPDARRAPSTAGSNSTGGRRSFTPQHPPAAGRLSGGGGGDSCMATPQHPSAMPQGHAARNGGFRNQATAWGSHPEFGDWGASERAPDDRIARLQAQLEIELKSQEEYYAKMEQDAKDASSVNF